VDPRFPHTGAWLLRATAHARRRASADADFAARQHQKQAALLDAIAAGTASPTNDQASPSSSSSGGGGGDAADEKAARVARDPDHYRVLGVAHDFTPDELRRAYRSASLAVHPVSG